jgi:DNA-directed RNA polymerase subunit beta
MPELMKEISFGKLDDKGMAMPHLLDIQTRAFEALLQLDAASHDREDIGLERVFKDLFPITDVHENFSLEFVRYTLGEPKYTVEECIERDMTYSAPLKATLQLVINEEVNGVKRPVSSRCSRRSAPSSSTGRSASSSASSTGRPASCSRRARTRTASG